MEKLIDRLSAVVAEGVFAPRREEYLRETDEEAAL